MSGRITIDVGLNTRDVAKGAKDAETALGKLEDAVGDTSKGGARDLDKLEDELKDVQRATERADASMKDVRSSSKTAFDGASDNVRGFKDEAVQNFSEVASSFSGDVTQMADGVQGLAGGLASALTPGIGIPVAILGAAAGAFLQSWIESSEQSKERISSMYQDMLDSGSRFLSDNYINQALGELGEDAGKVAEATKRAAEYRTSESDVLRAMVGDAEALGRVQADALSTHRQNVTEIQNSNKGEREKADLIDAANVKYEASTDWLRQIQQDTAAARGQWDAISGAMTKANDEAGKVSDTVFNFKQSLQGGITVPIRVDDTNLRNYKPPKIYVPGTIVMPGQRQIL